MPLAKVNDVALHYQRPLSERRGSSSGDVVLVHGLATNIAFWYMQLIPMLTPDFAISAYDLRGHGKSEMAPSGYTTRDMAADLEALLRHLGVKRPHLVGHSFGGAVALHFASLYPEKVASLTLADTRIRALQPTHRLSDWPSAQAWRRLWHELGVPGSADDPDADFRLLEAMAQARVEGRESPSMRLFSPFGASNGSSRTAELWLELLRSTTARRDIAATAGLTPDQVAQVRVPVLAVFGEYSSCLPSCRGLQRHLPNCRVAIVPRAGHFHPVSRPRFFETTLRAFLRDVAQ